MLIDLKLALISGREVLSDAVRSLLHLALGEDAELRSFTEFSHAIEDKSLANSDIVLLEADHQVVERILELRRAFLHISVVVLTQTADHDLGLQCIRAGAHDYVTLEDISPSSLFRSLRFALERREAQMALENSQAQLSQAQKMEAIGRMASGLAHDFRQYIQVIVGNSKVLQRLADDETMKQLVQDISQAGFGANELVSQVLDFAREGPLAKKTLELNSILKSNRAMVDSFGKKIKIEFDPYPRELWLQGDAVQLGQIILNLAINAVDACGDKGYVQLKTRPLILKRRYVDSCIVLEPGSYAILEIRDQGSGIPPEVREKLFDPFFTTKPRGKGTGLGLSTVFTLVAGLDGQVTFWTQGGIGTTFSVILPCSNPLSEEEPTPTPDYKLGQLIDHPGQRKMLRQDLKNLGIEALDFANLGDAIQWSSQEPESRRLLLSPERAPQGSPSTDNIILLSNLVAHEAESLKTLHPPFSREDLVRALS